MYISIYIYYKGKHRHINICKKIFNKFVNSDWFQH